MQQNGTEPPKVLLPVCPWCGEDPANILASMFSVGPMRCMAMHCGNPKCRKIFGTQVLEVAMPERKDSRIVLPS